MRSTHSRLGLALFAALVVLVGAPSAARAVCSSGGTVSDVNDCVPAGSSGRDCFLEWSVTPVPPLDNRGLPTRKITCVDNEACDHDNTPGQCTFMVGACVNVNDARIGCAPTGAASYEIKKPNERDAARAHKNRFERGNRKRLDAALASVIPSGTLDNCSAEEPVVVPLRNGTRKAKTRVKVRFTDTGGARDNDSLMFFCLPNPLIDTLPIASARQITSASELIGGPLATGRVGDWLIENDKVRFVVRDVGRDFSFMLTYGGHIMDADLQRGGGPGRDSFLAMTPLINISSTDNATSIAVVNDGSAGGPAVLQTSGPDDLFDPIDPAVAIKGFSTFLSVPPSAIDNNIPVTVVNEYTLAPGDDFVAMETIIENTGGTTLDLYVGDYLSHGGQLETVAPGLGFGESAVRIGGTTASNNLTLNYVGWIGFGEAAGLSYGLIPQIFDSTSSFAQSGVIVPVYGQNLVSILLAPDNNKPPGVLGIPAGQMGSFKRWFAVSDNGMGRVLDARHTLAERGEIDETIRTGFVQGTVTVAGEPVDGARVVIVRRPGDRGAQVGVVSVFDTADMGFYQGTLPRGDYIAMVKVPGHPYEVGGITPQFPNERAIRIRGGTTLVDFDVPATGWLQVDVTDGVSLQPLAAKVSLVGLETTPDPSITENAVLATVSGNVFGFDAREKTVIYGLAQAQFAGPNGTTGIFPIQPGDYQVVVSHGPEYSVSKQTITVTPGSAAAPQVVAASVVRVVDTPGFVSTDHHVHLINSPDSFISRSERIVSMLAEGVDYFVATDHDFLTDLSADVAALGASSLVKTAISDEITYFDSGHFNAYPFTAIDPASVTGGALDWGRAGEPVGLGYPSDGSYDLSVEEMALTAKAPPFDARVVQANHFNSGTLGYFRLAGIDTTVAPPQSSTSPAALRQDPALTNLYSDEITALEIWIENSRNQNALAVGENMGDWFNMLNNFGSAHPNLRKAAVCDSDTHSRVIVQAGGPRTMIASATDDPASIVPEDLADNLNDGRAVCTNGPYVTVSVVGDLLAEAGHALGKPLLVPATLGSATVNVTVHSPDWAEFDQVQIFVNNVPPCTTTAPNFVGGVKKVCTPAPNFTINPAVSSVAVNGSTRLEASVSQALTITQDSWVVVVVRGRDGISRPLFPMTPGSMLPKACSGDPCRPCNTNAQCSPFFGTCTVLNQTVSELGDGNLGQCGVTTLAIANPLFIDFDGDGFYKGVALP